MGRNGDPSFLPPPLLSTNPHLSFSLSPFPSSYFHPLAWMVPLLLRRLFPPPLVQLTCGGLRRRGEGFFLWQGRGRNASVIIKDLCMRRLTKTREKRSGEEASSIRHWSYTEEVAGGSKSGGIFFEADMV